MYYNQVEVCGLLYKPRPIGVFLFCDLKVEKYDPEMDRTYTTYIQVYSKNPGIISELNRNVNREVFLVGFLANTSYFSGCQVYVTNIFTVTGNEYFNVRNNKLKERTRA